MLRWYISLPGYNIVGDGTPQAFIPILTAQTEVELPMTRKRYSDANYVDVYPMIWKNFSKAGYVTLYAEDSAAVGTFTYRLKGFKEQPTDHYFRTFFMKTEKELSDRKCIGSEPQHVASCLMDFCDCTFQIASGVLFFSRYDADFIREIQVDTIFLMYSFCTLNRALCKI